LVKSVRLGRDDQLSYPRPRRGPKTKKPGAAASETEVSPLAAFLKAPAIRIKSARFSV
jgi:hypothetical protein